MTRLRAVLAIFLCLVALSCGDADHRTEIRFWNGFTGPDGRTMLGMVQDFNAAHGDTHVLMQRMDWSTYYNKVFVAGIGDRAPEVFVVHVDSLPRFASAGLLQDMEALFADDADWLANDFDANIMEQVRIGGTLWGVPLDVHMLGMYYNEDRFRDAGLVDEDGAVSVPTNRQEFEAALRIFQEQALSDEGAAIAWGFVLTWFRTNAYTLMAQNGGAFFDEEGRCVMANDRNAEALQYLVSLIREQELVPPPENFDSWIGFRQGRVAMAFEGVYMLADLQKTEDLAYRAAPAPLLMEQPAVWASSHVLCVGSDLSPEEKRAAAQLVRHLSDNSLDWAEGGQVPVRPSLRRTERFQAMTVQSVFASQMDHVVFPPQIEFSFEFWAEFDVAVERALRGSATPADALRDAQERLNEVIERREEMLSGVR